MKWHLVGRSSAVIVATLALLTVAIGGCSKSDPVRPALGAGGGNPPPIPGPPAPGPTPPAPGPSIPNSTNKFFPLRAGTTWHYRSSTSKGLQTQTVSVTSESQMVGATNTRVVTNEIQLAGQVIERTREFFAMDQGGDVWTFGRDRRVVDPVSGAETDVGSWRAGTAGARAGRVMLAHPDRGDTFTLQSVPGVSEAEAKVLSTNADAAGVPAQWAKNVLKIQITSPLDPNMRCERYYAPGVGLVMEVNMNGGRASRLQSIDTGVAMP